MSYNTKKMYAKGYTKDYTKIDLLNAQGYSKYIYPSQLMKVISCNG